MERVCAEKPTDKNVKEKYSKDEIISFFEYVNKRNGQEIKNR